MAKKATEEPSATEAETEEAPKVRFEALEANKIPFANDGLSSPSLFAETIRGASISWGVAKLSLIDHRVDQFTQEVKAVNVMTLIIPSNQMRNWGKFLIRHAPPDEEEAEEDAEPQDG